MGIFMDIFNSALRSLGDKAMEIQNNEAKYSKLFDDDVKRRLNNSSSSERIAAKRVLEDRGYQFKKD